MACGYQNLPAWIILDSGFLDKYPFATRYPGDPVPDWLISAPSIGALAKKLGIDAEALEATIERFNVNAEHGKDPDFKRGESKYDGFFADRSKANAYSTLGPLNQSPYYACRVYAGVLGTRGGTKINARAEVLNFQGEGLPGLSAAGNVSAGFSGMGYPGAGATIGPALVFGHIAGREAASEDNHF
jgi:predicted oxidoreductase